MSAFGGLVLTTKGRNLQAKAQAGAQLNFTRIGVGDGELAGSSILELNALKHEVKTLNITKLKSLTGGKAAVGGVLSNQGLASGFYWRELGLFAQDPDIGEILYCYGNSGVNAEYIPADGGPDVLEKSIDIISIVGNAANVTATIEQSLIFETPAGAQSKADEAEDSANTFASGLIGTLTDLATTVKTNIVAAINEIRNALTTHTADYTLQVPYAVTTGTANTYAITLNPAITAYVAGMAVCIKVNVANTGASTLNVNAKDAKTILDSKGNALTSGKLRLNGVYTLRYDGTNFILQGDGGSGDAVASDLRLGKKASTDAGDIVGDMPDGAVAPAGTRAQTNYVIYKPAKGYYDGVQEIYEYSAAVQAAKIKLGENLYGLVGTLIAKIPSQIVAYNNLNQLGMALYYRSDIDLTFNISAGGMNIVVGNHGAIPAYLTVYSGAPVDLTDVQFITIQFSANIGSTGGTTPTIQAGVSLANTDNATFAASASFTPPATQNTHVTSAVIDVRAITGLHYLKIRVSNATYSGVNNTMTVGSMFLVQ
jgi:hypothetical protein